MKRLTQKLELTNKDVEYLMNLLEKQNDEKSAKVWDEIDNQCEAKWIKDFIVYKGTEYQYEAKVYVLPSEYGIRRGRISKLAIWKNEEFDGVVEGLRTAPLLFNYDRGYDIQAENQDVADVREIIIKEYN